MPYLYRQYYNEDFVLKMNLKNYKGRRVSKQMRILALLPLLFLLFGYSAQGKSFIGQWETDSINRPEFKLNTPTWKIGVNYTFLPFPKLDEGTVKYGNMGFSIDNQVRPKFWLGTGLGLSFWEYHKRTVTRTIDQILIDPTTKAISYTFIDSVTGFTNKFSFISVPAKIRLDLISLENQTIFISTGAGLNIAFRELEGFENNSSRSKTTGTPDRFTFFLFGTFSLGYEYHQFKGWSTAVSLDYCRTLVSRGITEQMNNYFGATVSLFFDLSKRN